MAQLRKIQTNAKNAKPLKNNLVPVNERVKCDTCSGYVREADQVVKYKEQSYHLKCFKCVKCHRSMKDQKVFMDVETHKLYCETCYMSMLDKCAACNKPIVDKMVTLGPKQKLHQACFTCSGCKQPLETYIEHEEKRFCQACYMATCLPTCVSCSKPLRVHHDGQTLEELNYDGKYFHPECFLCDACNGSLDQESNSQPESDQKPTITASNVRGPENREANSGPPIVSKMYFPVDGKKLCQKCAIAKQLEAVNKSA